MRLHVVLASLLPCALLVTPALFAQPGPPPVPQATVTVDCDAGETLADALETRADELTIEFTGTCAEELVITRDRLTIRGLDASATVTDDPATTGFNPSFLLQGADVVFQDFTIDGSENRGIRVQGSSETRVENLTVQNNGGTGLTIEESSSAHVTDSTFNDNAFAGIAAWGNSNVTVTGTIDVSSNLVGVLVSTGSTLQSRNGQVIVADDQTFGVAVQLGASGQWPPLEAANNTAGLVSFGGAYLGSVTFTNSPIGIFLSNRGSFDGGVDVSAVNSGIQVTEDSTALLRGGTLAAPTALFVFNGVVEAGGVTFDGDVSLQFNAQAFFDTSATTGVVSCFPSALAGGSITCPAPLLGNALRLGGDAPSRVTLPQSLPFVQPD